MLQHDLIGSFTEHINRKRKQRRPAVDGLARKWRVTIISNDYFITVIKKARWEARARKALDPSVETIRAVALDLHGNLAAASPTEVLTLKMKGWIGDTAVIGAGLSVDHNVAVV